MPRIFLALNFSLSVTRKIAEEVERKKPAMTEAGFRVAWVPAANLHLTVKFLGSIREEAIEGVVGGLNRIAPRHQPFEARAQALGAFPSPAKPSVLWVGVDSPSLAAFHKDVEGAMLELGFEKEERVFHPHVTVGRVKEARGDASAIWASNADCGASLMTEIVVYESKTRSAGAEYIARARVPLGIKENR
jgi:RNA 2',3'-cyclic 3'-phosphodiesterase